MSAFFERLKGDQDPDMIQKCFVTSAESNLAEQKLLRIASDLTERIRNLNPKTGEELVSLIENVKLTHSNRFVLFVGSKGAGKSTFITRFFQTVLPNDLASDIKLVRIDLAKNNGDVGEVVRWLNDEILKETEKVVLSSNENTDGWNEIIGKIFFDDYQRWSNQTMKHLYDKDKDQFKIEFGRHIENLRKENPSDYIRKLISYLTKSHQKIPCLIFDNTDHFSIQFQEIVFQYARALYESEFCITIMPITDKTSWQLSKQGALQSFESEALYLPVPRPEKVIEKRISYLVEKLGGPENKAPAKYFFEKGIKLGLSDIAEFAASLNKIFIETPRISEWIGGLANHDIRRLLEIVRETIASPHLQLDDLFKAKVAESAIVIPQHKIKSAIIKKRYNIYPVGEHAFVQNVFFQDAEPPSSPLLNLRVMQYVRDATTDSLDKQLDFVPVNNIYDYCKNMGIQTSATQSCVSRLLKQGLLLNFDPTMTDLNEESKLELAPSGKVHFWWATVDREYISIMRDVTPLLDKEVCMEIRKLYRDYRNNWARSIKCFVDYLIGEDEIYCNIPDQSAFNRQRKLTKGLLRLSKNLQKEIEQAAA